MKEDAKKNFKERTKEFYEEHKKMIFVVGGLTVLTLMKLYNSATYTKGFMDGGVNSFYITMDYFDENHGTNLNKIFEEFSKEHPEQIVNWKFK